MIIGNYFGCLSGQGMETGNLKVFYDFTSGSGNFVYNSVFSYGEQVHLGRFISTKFPGVIVRTGSSIVSNIITGLFNGNDLIKIGNSAPFSEFSSFIDFNQNFCSASSVESRLLLSSQYSGASGFNFGINQSNRLFFEYPSSDSIRRHTSSYELTDNNTIFLSVADNKAVVGLYDYELEKVVSESFPLKNYVDSNNWHLGGAFNFSGTSHTGFQGHIKNFIVFDKSLTELYNRPIECLSCSGITWDSNISSFPIYGASEFTFSTSSVSGITGYSYLTTNVPHPTGGYSTLTYESGLIGVVSRKRDVGIISDIMSSGSSTGVFSTIEFDYSARLPYANKTLSFSNPIPSGYLVEIYSYLRPHSELNIPSVDFNLYKLGYKNAALWQNGVLNLDGIDYRMNGNKYIGAEEQGYDDSDVFEYNLLTGNIISVPYSGLWERSKIFLNSGTYLTDDGGEAYFPPYQQYLSSGDAIFITGVSGLCPTGYDLYLNGKKLTEGYDFSVGSTGLLPSVVLSGENLPDFSATVSISGDGNVYGWPYSYSPTGIYDIHTPILTFVEKNQNFALDRLVFLNTGADIYQYEITGFSEEIWVNGIKQHRNYAYNRTYPCSPTSGLYDYPKWTKLIYNNDTSHFNI